MLVGVICGLVNGLIVTRIGINALIATLGHADDLPQPDLRHRRHRRHADHRRLRRLWPRGRSAAAHPVAVLGDAGAGRWSAAGWSPRTRFFRQYYFIGGNPRAAQLSGIRVERLILIGFIIMGVLAGLAGVLGAARLNSAVVNAGVGIELKVITATVLGGASLKGGEGTILGGILGVLFIALIENAMIINAVGVFWQGMVVGLVLLFAVSLDRFKTQRPRLNRRQRARPFGSNRTARQRLNEENKEETSMKAIWIGPALRSLPRRWLCAMPAHARRNRPSDRPTPRRPTTGSPTRPTCRCSCSTTMSA